MRIKNNKCSGVSIAEGPKMVIQNSIIESNGAACPGAPPGAGIYAEGTGSASNYAPIITGNTIRNNGGPALDVNSVWGGTFNNNTVNSNSSWAAVSLFGAGHWTIAYNSISHPATSEGQPYHSECRGGPGGVHSSAIFLCQDRGVNNAVTIYNSIHDNGASSWYGILLIGNDEVAPYLVPRFNTLQNNNVIGSYFGCADDYRPGQWMDGDNAWTGNTCQGTPNTGPTYF
jgi:hypothetical protein